MIGRAFQWIGALALLGIGVAGIGSLLLVKDRIRVVVQEEDVAEKPDPQALIRDELGQLRADFSALAAALEKNLGQVGGYLERLAGAQERQGSELGQRLDRFALESAASVGERLRHLETALATLDESVRALGSHPLAPGAPGGSPPIAVQPPASGSEPPAALPEKEAGSPGRSDVAAVTAGPGAAEEDPLPPATEARAPEKTVGFLSFALPSSSFAFDAPSHYRVLPELSRVGFDAKSTLHDFSGVTSKILGDVHANLADPGYAWHGAIECEAAALRTGVEGRDAGMFERLKTKEHPRIRFEIERFTADPDAIDVQAQRCRGVAHGRMSIAGQSKEFAMPIELAVDESKRVLVQGQQKLRLSDYGIAAPSQLGLISMQDEVVVWISLRARRVGPAEGTKEVHRDE